MEAIVKVKHKNEARSYSSYNKIATTIIFEVMPWDRNSNLPKELVWFTTSETDFEENKLYKIAFKQADSPNLKHISYVRKIKGAAITLQKDFKHEKALSDMLEEMRATLVNAGITSQQFNSCLGVFYKAKSLFSKEEYDELITKLSFKEL